MLVKLVVRGRVELPTFRFSGRTYPQLARIVRVLRTVAGRWRLPAVAAVAVTVAVSPGQGSRWPSSNRSLVSGVNSVSGRITSLEGWPHIAVTGPDLVVRVALRRRD